MNYAYENGKIYFHSAIAGRKIDLIKTNNQVCFNIEGNYEIVKAQKACGWSAKYRSIIGYGSIRIEESEEIKIKGLDLIMKKYGAEGKQEYAIGALKNTAMIVISIDELSAKQSGN